MSRQEKSRASRLRLECLEDRVVPTTVQIPLPSGDTVAGSAVVNSQGQVAGVASGNGQEQAFFWSPSTGTVAIPLPSGDTVVSNMILNNQGQVAGAAGHFISPSSASSSYIIHNGYFQYQAFFWSQSTGTVAIPGVENVNGLDDAGQVLAIEPSGLQLWNPTTGSEQPIPLPSGDNGVITATLNGRGQIVGAADRNDQEQPFYWSPSTGIVAIPLPSGDTVVSNMIVNNQGQVAGAAGHFISPSPASSSYMIHNGYFQYQAFFWTPSTGTVAIPGAQTVNGLNDASQLLASGSSGLQLWNLSTESEQSVPLPSGDTDAVAASLNDQGQVAGGASGNGQEQAFFWSPSTGMIAIPVPSGDTFVSNMLVNSQGLVAGTAGNWVPPSASASSFFGHYQYQAFFWSQSSGTVAIPGAGDVFGLNDAGQVLAYGSSGLFLWGGDTWTGDGSNDLWSNPDNWAGDSVPTAGADLVFPAGANQLSSQDDLSYSFDSITTSDDYSFSGQDLTTGSLTVQSGTLELDLSATVSSGGSVNEGANLTVGDQGSLEIQGGFSVDGTLDVAGTVTADAGSNLTADGTITLELGGGGTGTGTLIIQGTVSVDGTFDDQNSGTLTVDSGGNLSIGGTFTLGSYSSLDDQGTLTVESGGALTDGNAITVEANATLTVDGSLTVETADSLTDSGTLNVGSGGTIDDEQLVTIDYGAALDDSGSVSVGAAGRLLDEDQMSIQPGGSMTVEGSVTVQLGSTIDTAGSVSVEKGGSLLDEGEAIVEAAGKLVDDGTVTIQGTTVNKTPILAFDDKGSVDVSSGAMLNDGGESIVESKAALDDSGTLEVTGYTLTVDGTLTVESKAQLLIYGSVEISSGGSLNGPGSVVVESGGTLSDQDAVTVPLGGILDVFGTETEGTGGNMTVDGSLIVEPSGSLNVIGSVTIESDGAYFPVGNVDVEPGATFNLDALPTPLVTVNGGPFTYNGNSQSASATALGEGGVQVSGTFSLTYDGSATAPTDAGTYDVAATFTSSDPDYGNASGSGTLVINPATPTFTNLSAPTILAGTTSTIVSGTLGSNAGTQLIPAGETVQVTLDGVTQSATLDANDDFSTTFDTSSLLVSPTPYPISLSYAGDSNFNAITGSSTLTVNADLPDPTKSTVSVSAGSAAAGTPITITLQAVDANGNDLTTGGDTVTFALGSATGGQGTFAPIPATDNGNGTYTATFTGATAGSNTISATINGQSVTTTAPTITITPAAVSAANSLISLSLPANQQAIQLGGTTTITIAELDAYENADPTGIETPKLSLSGTAAGNFGNVVSLGNGVYTATFTATADGNSTILATIGGSSAGTDSPPTTIAVSGAAVSDSKSTVKVSTNPDPSGTSTTITLQAEDAKGHLETAGGLTVTFALSNTKAGAKGAFGPVIDNHNGTYSATFTGTIAGSNTIVATIDNKKVSKTASIKVTPGVYSLAESVVTVTSKPVKVGSKVTVTLELKDAAGNKVSEPHLFVTFTLGDGTTVGTIGAAKYNPNGTYTATFTATTAGTNTITATVGTTSTNGQLLTSAPPTIAVEAKTGAPNEMLAVGGAVAVMEQAGDYFDDGEGVLQ